MLKKAILGTPKAFKVSIGSQSHCTASVEKSLYAPGELVTVTIAYNVGHNNAVVGTSTGTPVKKVSDTKYTFLMPNKDVVITASASVMSFKITINKNDGGSVSVKSVANYGETVTVTLSPSEGYSVGNVSASGVGLSGSGNTRTFSMPAGNVVLNVSFKLEYHIIMTVGLNRSRYGAWPRNGGHGAFSREPYWGNPSAYLEKLYAASGATFVSLHSSLGMQYLKINGIQFECSISNPGDPLSLKDIFTNNINNRTIKLVFDPPYWIPIRKSRDIFVSNQWRVY